MTQTNTRRLPSFIDAFVTHTANVETPAIFRKWAAITTIGAVLEQKVWIMTTGKVHPNFYTFMIAAPGVGKTRVINEASKMVRALPEPHIAPTSVNHASLVDALLECKRTIINMPEAPLEYNSMCMFADELGTFMSKYEDDLVGLLSSFYDVQPYGQRRRGNNLKIKIDSPQLTILAGSTPSNLLKFMPEGAWDQGFTSRIMFVYSDERNIVDDFAEVYLEEPVDLIHDLKIINNLIGQFKVTEDYRTAINNWRALGEPPRPTHPRLLHYATRRKTHLYRLSIVAAVDRSNTLLLTKEDFNRAMGWMLEIEEEMPLIFKSSSSASDSAAMEEIMHYVQSSDRGQGIREGKLVTFVRERVPAHAVLRVIEVMEKSEMIYVASVDKQGLRMFRKGPRPVKPNLEIVLPD